MKKQRSNKKAIIITISAVCVIGIIIGAMLSNKSDKPIEVSFGTVEKRTIVQTVSATGKIQPETKVKISPEVSGEIVQLNVKEGDVVSKGHLLAKINPAIIETQLEQYKAMKNAAKENVVSIKVQLDNLEIELNRAKELYSKNVISKQELDKAQANYDATNANYNAQVAQLENATATLKQIETEAKKTTIFAPIDGVVTSLLVEKGERVVGTNMMSGTEMMTVSDLGIMNAEVDVDENDIVLVKIGDTANIEIDAIPNKVFKGVVIEVGHSASNNTGMSATNQTTTFGVKIRLIDVANELRPGMSCNVEIETTTRQNVLSVPLQSVTTREIELKSDAIITAEEDFASPTKETTAFGNKTPKTIIFVKDGDTAKQKEIEIGISNIGYIEVISGLEEGEVVITGSYQAVSKLLSDGTKIKEEVIVSKK
ncbi:MAG: efflux RND transporter periplasmic adaptor subunit [Bacteroidetes bacterium]|nr:efflux RND transporter periplasmic adaptor subunit [Bacteroidota bacterium]